MGYALGIVGSPYLVYMKARRHLPKAIQPGSKKQNQQDYKPQIYPYITLLKMFDHRLLFP